MQRRGQRSMAKCPRFTTKMEDKLHILCYQAPGARQQWMASIKKTVFMVASPGNGTYDMRCDITQFGGMGAGSTATTGALIDTIWERTDTNWMGKDPRLMAPNTGMYNKNRHGAKSDHKNQVLDGQQH